MRAAQRRASETGALDAPGAEPLLPTEGDDSEGIAAEGYKTSLLDFTVPLLVLLGVAIVPYILSKFDLVQSGNWIFEAFALALLAGMGVAMIRGMALRTLLAGFVEGCQAMTIGALILAFAVTLGWVSKELRTADFVVSVIADGMPAVALPATLTFLAMGIAFATGSSWGTYAVLFPVAMPLAWAVQPDETFALVCFGSVLGGSVFGDQCSPISDTTILSSMFTGCDLMDHVRTQFPLALMMASLGAALSTVLVI